MALVQLLWVPPTPLPPVAPTVFELCSQVFICFVLFDFSYFVFHITCHKVFRLFVQP